VDCKLRREYFQAGIALHEKGEPSLNSGTHAACFALCIRCFRLLAEHVTDALVMRWSRALVQSVRYLPVKFGLRFSTNAATPSLKSSVRAQSAK
jgi:hypothetical protein